MRILRYAYKDQAQGGWEFTPTELHNVNLLVGPTGSGKSRYLNSIFNIGEAVAQGKFLAGGIWQINFEIGTAKYVWQYEARGGNSEDATIAREFLTRTDPDGSSTKIVDRAEDQGFSYMGQRLPKLSKTTSALHLLRDEADVQPVFAGFGLIARRNFWGSDLQNACQMSNMPGTLVAQLKGGGPDAVRARNLLISMPIGPRVQALQETEKDNFELLVDQYKSIFPTIEDVYIKDGAQMVPEIAIGRVPVLAFKERNVTQPVLLHELSSGMQKVFLIMLDVLTLPEGSIYLVDEYENSLGTNAINFLPTFLSDFGAARQFLVTSHHPYLINSTPMQDWLVFKRIGSRVEIQQGDTLIKKYGLSKQDAFVQLMNDPEFRGLGL
jgi:energy-coupling factor transporter ATP-binding protein EcfA2